MADIFSLTLTGDQEAPTPVATDASGTGAVVWDAATSTAAYTVAVQGLDFGTALGREPQTADTTDDVTVMHVHNAARGAPGPVVSGQIGPAQDADDISFTLNADGSWTVRGIWEPTDPANVSIEAFADALTAAAVGSDVALYFNVYSTAFPAGEIRGQWVAAGSRQDGTGGGDTIAAPTGEALVALGRGGDDSLNGGDLADLLEGGSGDDTLSGLGGDDTIEGGTGDDTVNTGLGNDQVSSGAGQDSVGGMAGRDTVFGGAGDDVIACNDATGDLAFGGAGNDSLIGGDVAVDTIFGGGGDDLIRAFATDPAAAGTAADELSGGAGDDTIFGGDAADTIHGGAGNDVLAGNRGADTFVFRDGQATGDDVINDFERGGDVVRLIGFGAGFDALANLGAVEGGTALDLGGGDRVVFLGRLVFEFAAEDFVLG
jgi:Ca2+-binding RTX toxin-like protein